MGGICSGDFNSHEEQEGHHSHSRGTHVFFLMMLTGYNLNECVQKHGAELDRQMPSTNHVNDNC